MTTRLSCATRHKRLKKCALVFAVPLVATLSLGMPIAAFLSESAAAAAALPDLVVTNIVKPTVAPGGLVKFTATVKNQGAAATPAGTILGVQFQVDGKAPITWSDTDKTSLAPGASVTLTANGGQVAAGWTATGGAHSVRAWVDDVNRIAESNETNNTLTSAFTVSAAAPPAGLPDLVVTGIAQPNVAAGGAVQFSATVTNQGDGSHSHWCDYRGAIPGRRNRSADVE